MTNDLHGGQGNTVGDQPGVGVVNVRHHPDDELLLDYASGALGEAESLVIATHMALCPICRRKVADYEAIGGATLEAAEEIPVADDALARIMASIDAGLSDKKSSEQIDFKTESFDANIPQPLRDYLPSTLENLPWQSVLRGLDEVTLQVGSNDMVRTKMLRIQPGAAMPQHTHEGTELTLVLCGAFQDERGHFARGDLAFTDSNVEHRPVADEGEVCYCLAVTTAPLRLTGPVGRFFNSFIKY